MDKLKVLQIVGYKNSGKTTLITNLITLLREEGFQVATLKHHGHGGVPLGFSMTDSEKYRRGGAILSGVEGDGVLQLSSDSWNLEKMISIYEIMEVDILLIEGFKREDFEKVFVVKQEGDLSLLPTLSKVVAVISPFQITKNLKAPCFYLSEMDVFYTWIKQKFGEENTLSE